MREQLERQAGVLRSLAIYYAPGRVRRLSRFYAPFIRPGDLCFDVGAHVGNRVAAWRRLGARVVAVEPQAHLHGWLRRLYGRSPDVTPVSYTHLLARRQAAAGNEVAVFCPEEGDDSGLSLIHI